MYVNVGLTVNIVLRIMYKNNKNIFLTVSVIIIAYLRHNLHVIMLKEEKKGKCIKQVGFSLTFVVIKGDTNYWSIFHLRST